MIIFTIFLGHQNSSPGHDQEMGHFWLIPSSFQLSITVFMGLPGFLLSFLFLFTCIIFNTMVSYIKGGMQAKGI
jgi:hypothetical protein